MFNYNAFLLVYDWVGVHCEDAFPEESLILVLYLHQVDAALQVGSKGLLLLFGVFVGIIRSAVQQIDCHIIAREELIAGMNLLVDAAGNLCEDLRLGHFRELIKPVVDGRHCFVVDAALLSEDASLHVVEVVLFALLERRIVALLLELLSFEVIAGIVLIADAERHDVELLESVDDAAFSSHRKHLEQRLLRLVATVLGSSFALCNPDVFVLLRNGVMHVAAHSLTALQEFPRTEPPFDRKGFIELDERLNPRIDEEVVADGYLTSRRELVLVEHEVEDGAVEHNVAMIADEGVTLGARRDAAVGEATATAAFAKDMLQHGLDEPQLELKRCIDADKSQAEKAVSHPARHPGNKAFQHPGELPVGKKTLDGLLYLAFRKGADLIEFIDH